MILLQLFLLLRTSWTDLRSRKILNRDLAIGELLQLATLHRINLTLSTVTTVALVMLRRLSRDGLGFGDIKLLVLLASWSGPSMGWVTFLVLGFGCAGCYATVSAILRRKWRASIPLAPALLAGLLLQTLMHG